MTTINAPMPGARSRERSAADRRLAGITAGLVIAIIDIAVEISLAALVFSGALAGFVANGIGYFLFGALVLCIVVSLTSSFRGMVTLPQDSPAAILGVMAASIAGGMPPSASPDDAFVTVVVAIVVTSLSAGSSSWCWAASGWARWSAKSPTRWWAASWPAPAGCWCAARSEC